MKLKNQKWFVLLAILAVSMAIVSSSNRFFTEDGVLRELQVAHPTIEKIIKTESNFFNYSKIYVEFIDGSQAVYELDSNIFFSYKFYPVKFGER